MNKWFRRSALFIAGVLSGLFFLWAIYAYWGGQLFRNEASEVMRDTAAAYLAYGTASLLVAVAIWLAGFRKVGRIAVGSIVTVSLIIAAVPFVVEWLNQDACLDSGGRWLGNVGRCER